MCLKRVLLYPVVFLLMSLSGFSQELEIEKRAYSTQQIDAQQVPVIDGKLDEEVWSGEGWGQRFIQREPNENAEPDEQTTFKIIYDPEFLYIGIKCFDAEPDKINRRMTRRDGAEGDWVEVLFDSDHDLRTAFSFTLSAAGVQGDKKILLNGSQEDDTWNPVWYSGSNISEEGWTSEMKIPLSQLRFSASDGLTWGLQIVRRLSRNEELSVWQRVPLDAAGWVSEFGELTGLNDLSAEKHLEIQPFIVNSLNTFETVPQNPFRDSSIKSVEFGVDGKFSITNNLTLDFTANPDFGQVEADPAAIALDGFQLFFNERRPFFVENKNIFDYRFSTAIVGGPFSSDNLFYSRRIGRAPQGSVQTNGDGFINMPARTTILGAVKLSGKTKSGLSLGLMESVTGTEYAEISGTDGVDEVVVEPLTNYFVGRAQQDLNNKNTYIGGIITSVVRDNNENVSFLHKSALTGGLDFKHQWNDRSWYVDNNLVFSRVAGTKESILNTQTSLRRLYQRVDAGHVSVDSTKTSLSGHGGDLKVGKAGKGHVKFETGLTWRSPGLELNDIGFLREADDIQNYMGATYSSLRPFSLFRSATIGYNHWYTWDFEGNHNYHDWDIDINSVFKNNWFSTLGLFIQPHIYSKSILRGGPRIRLPDQRGLWWEVGSDRRRKFYAYLYGWTKRGGEDAYRLLENWLTVTYQPINQLRLSLSPRYVTTDNRLQYIGQANFQGDARYLTAKLSQETFSTSLRLNYAQSSTLSIQYYGEVYLSSGEYDRYSYVQNPLADSEREQLVRYDDAQLTSAANGGFQVDEDRNGTADYSFNDLDFSFAQFRSNLVVRYEYRPGSAIFLVWSQGINDYSTPGSGLANRFREQIIKKRPENTFLIKATYRFFK
ncbi:MAG: DUF5916 domain-containing protein [Calditrichia bacterium]